MARKHPRAYSADFRLKVVELARQTVRNWIKQADLDAGRRKDGLTSLDVFSRRVVGWAMATHMRAELVVDALDMAIHNRKPKNASAEGHSELRRPLDTI